MYDRARVSPVVEKFVEGVDETWRRMLGNVLGSRLEEPNLSLAVDALIATIQGALFQRRSRAERRRLIAFALERFTGSG